MKLKPQTEEKVKADLKAERNDCIESFLDENKAKDYSQGDIKGKNILL